MWNFSKMSPWAIFNGNKYHMALCLVPLWKLLQGSFKIKFVTLDTLYYKYWSIQTYFTKPTYHLDGTLEHQKYKFKCWMVIKDILYYGFKYIWSIFLLNVHKNWIFLNDQSKMPLSKNYLGLYLLPISEL